MSGWFPVSACTSDCVTDPAPCLGRIGRTRRWTRVAATLASAPAPRPRRSPSTAARALVALGVTVDVVPPATPWPAGGALIVSNHVSWLDDVALLAHLPGARPVAKAEIADWPVVGDAARRAGTVFVDRMRLRRLPAAVAEVTDVLRSGGSVLVHPEGTTACGSELGRFRPAFFQSAVDAGVPVCPVALRYRLTDGTGTAVAGYLGGDSLRASLGRVVATRGLVLELHLLPPIQPGTDRRELAALAEYSVASVTESRSPDVSAHRRSAGAAPTRRPGRRAPVGVTDPAVR